MSPTLAVVLPTLNEEELLPRLLARLVSEEDRPERIVVSDGGSADRTVELAERAGCDVVCGEAGRGPQLARGAMQAREDILLFLHADTLPAHGALDSLRERYEEPSVCVTAMSQRVEADGWFYRSVERFADFRSGRLGVVYGDSGLAVRRALYCESGGFSDLSVFEDVEFSRRLKRMARIHLVREATLLISARRWKTEGALSCTLRNWMLMGAYFLGRDPERLARHYLPHSR